MFARISKYWIQAFVFAFGVCALCLMFAGAAFAQQGWDKRTMVTFDAPVEIPGISAQVLPAGTYVFRLADSAGNRHVVQIYNRDETHLYANILTVPNYRLRPTEKTVITFSERKAGEPQAIRAWFYPGDNSGQEFVYPRKRAVELAKETNLPVLYIPEEIAPNIVAPAATPAAPPIIALREAPLLAVTPAGQDVAVAEVVVPPPVQTASAALPKTASALPLLALMGLFCLLVGLWRQPLCVR